jgi:Pyruvate/2-oxoacid:ferredoxin oxidoreductase delta subunit
MNPYVIRDYCTACEICPPLCPTRSIFFSKFSKTQFVIDTDTCNGCGICAAVCPVDAIAPMETPTESHLSKR